MWKIQENVQDCTIKNTLLLIKKGYNTFKEAEKVFICRFAYASNEKG